MISVPLDILETHFDVIALRFLSITSKYYQKVADKNPKIHESDRIHDIVTEYFDVQPINKILWELIRGGEKEMLRKLFSEIEIPSSVFVFLSVLPEKVATKVFDELFLECGPLWGWNLPLNVSESHHLLRILQRKNARAFKHFNCLSKDPIISYTATPRQCLEYDNPVLFFAFKEPGLGITEIVKQDSVRCFESYMISTTLCKLNTGMSRMVVRMVLNTAFDFDSIKIFTSLVERFGIMRNVIYKRLVCGNKKKCYKIYDYLMK